MSRIVALLNRGSRRRRAGVGICLAVSVILVWALGRRTPSVTDEPLPPGRLNLSGLNVAAQLPMRPFQFAAPAQLANSVAANKDGKRENSPSSDTDGSHLLALTAATEPRPSDSPVIASLPPVERAAEIDAAAQRNDTDTENEPALDPSLSGPALDAPSGVTSSTGGNHSATTSKVRALPPEFAAAFAVTPKARADADKLLAPLSGPSEPTPQLIALARQADAHIASGLSVAQRGASYTARAEFIKALQLSAAALDQQRQTVAHARAIANGLQALQEAEDFLPAIAAAQTHSIATIVESHRTPLLHDESNEDLTPWQALQQYLGYAQEQLAAGSGDLQPAASALYALGKLEMHSVSAEIGSFASARAAVYLQAALVVNPQHALAANELGVLFARHGRLAEAKAVLLHSVRMGAQGAAWRNLAIVHQSLGENDLAQRADWESRQLSSTSPAGRQPTLQARRQSSHTSVRGRAADTSKSEADGAVPHVEWLDPAAFAQTNNLTGGVPMPTAAPPSSAHESTSTAQVPSKGNANSTSLLLPWWRKTR